MNFWLDSWGGNSALFNAVIDDQSISNPMAKCIDMTGEDGEWDWDNFVSKIPLEAVRNITSIKPPCASNGADQLAWKFSKEGVCTVKSVYEQLEKANWQEQRTDWLLPWKWDGPERIRVFLWLLMRGAVLTNVNRVRRCLTVDASCSICGANEEDLDHIFRRCSGVQQIWRDAFVDVNFSMGENLSFREWLCVNIANQSQVNDCSWSTLFGSIMWYVWKRRNQFVFTQEWIPNSVVVKQGIDLGVQVAGLGGKMMKKAKQCLNLSWEPPSHGWYKINTDGAMRGNANLATAGGVIRDCYGNWIAGFGKNIGHAGVFHAKLWGAFEGLKLA